MVKVIIKKLNESQTNFWDNPEPFQYEIISMNKFLEQSGNELSSEYYVNT